MQNSMTKKEQLVIEMQDIVGSNVAATSNNVASNTIEPRSSDCEGRNSVDADGFELVKMEKSKRKDTGEDRLKRLNSFNSYAANKNVAEGLMDIALLSANANQLRFLLTYNHEASTFYISLGLVGLSLVLQVAVGIALIFKRRLKCCQDKCYIRTNEFLIVGVFMITVVNILLAAFTTTDGNK